MGPPKPLTRAELNLAKCTDPSCKAAHEAEGVFIHAPCHPRAPVGVLYLREKGVLQLMCVVCGTAGPQIQVASDA